MRFDTPVISGSLIIASSTTASFFNGRIDLYETASANFIRFKAPENISASYVLTLPTASGQAGQAMIYDGSGSLYFGTVASSGGSTTILTAGISDVKAVGTGGGSAPSGSWQVRTLNTVDWDEIGLTVANNTITLPTGSYLIEASAPAYAVDEHQIRLFNSSSLSTLAYGSIEFASAVNGGSNRSVLQHSITVSGSIDIQLHHKVATSNLTPEGFGISDTGSFLNSTEIFSYLRIIKYQPALVYNNAYNTYSRTCRIIDLKASGSGGGAAVTGSWINRDLNTKSWDDIGVTLDTGSGIFTIPSGSYLLSISSPAHAVDEHQIRLYNTSSNSVEGYGTVEFAASTTGGTTRSHIFVKINNIANQSFTVQHRVGTSNTSIEALGTNTYDVLSDSEIFTTVDIVKYAHPALEPVAVLNDLLDVDTTGPVDDNYILSYDSASSAYRPISPTTARGFLSHWTASISGIYRSGDVGIGKVPTKLLDVNGDALVNGLTVGRGLGNFSDNTALGTDALPSNVSGDYSTAIGYQSLYSNTDGFFNTANGAQSLYSNTTGYQNSAYGLQSLYTNISGRGNAAFGHKSLFFNDYGNYNVAVGYEALYTNADGVGNIGIGYQSLYKNAVGIDNVAIGYQAGRYIFNKSTDAVSLDNSIFLGWRASPSASYQTNQIVIGYDATGVGSNSVVLGNDSITKTILKGNVGIDTISPSEKLEVNGNGLFQNLGINSAISPYSNIYISSTDKTVPISIIGQFPRIRFTDSDVAGYSEIRGDGTSLDFIADVGNAQANSAIVFRTDNVEAMRINSSGNVGIGTTSPNSQLSLGKSNNINIDFQLTGLHGSQSSARIYNAYDAVSWGQNRLTFAVNNGTGVPIDVMSIKNGNVGIGTTNPSAKLEISSSLFSTKMLYAKSSLGYNIFEVEEGGLGAGNMFLRNSSGNTTIQLASGGNVYFDTGGNVGIGTGSPSARLEVVAGSASPTLKLGRTTGQPSIKSTGDWLIMDSNTAELGLNYYVNKNVVIAYGGGNVGIGISPSHPIHLASGAHCTAAGTWTNASDIAYKYNIEDLGYGLEDVMKLKPREFDMLADNSHTIGFVAQELEEVIPEIVSGEDGYKGVGYGPLVAVLVKAIQQQQSMLDVQQSLLDAQLKMIENLQEKVMMNTSIIEEMFNNG